MAEPREIRDLFERDLRQIEVPPESEWFRTVAAERPMPRWLLATTAVAAIILALVIGSYLYTRLPEKPGTVLAPPSPTATVRSPLFAQVSGRVSDAVSGEPLAGVRVSLIATDQLRLFKTVGTALTDASGRYQIMVIHGTYRVFFFWARSGQPGVCWRPGPCGADDVIASTSYEPLWWPAGTTESQGAELKIDDDRNDVDGSLKLGHDIVGSFTFGGNPVRAIVVVERAGNKDLIVVGITNLDGTFRIPVADGSYYMEFAPLENGPTGGAWPTDIVVQGADVVGIDRVEP